MARVRMSDVAAHAGVSTATVSMVLNGVNTTRISAETQQRVREAASV
ncbi:LacI family DNA-binding transcriptional regulator [Kibdelosporangium lantanae]|uniref:LacI family DNA-binding transcriptional regulator n=1 Tax=Kibdelosporangium lantanae TaxID=1497396 RepID=A0ABW3M9R8_9PSEU